VLLANPQFAADPAAPAAERQYRQLHGTKGILLIDPKSVRKVVARARKLAKEFREVCGALVEHGGVVALVETRNRRRRAGSFWINPTDWKKIRNAAKTLGSEVVGTFHSHVVADPVPGPGDIRGAYEGHAMIIIDAWTSELRAWRIRGERAYRLRHRFLGPSANPLSQRTGASVALRATSRARAERQYR